MPEESTCLNCRTYQRKHNGTAVLTYEQRTKQLYWEPIQMYMLPNKKSPQLLNKVMQHTFKLWSLSGEAGHVLTCERHAEQLHREQISTHTNVQAAWQNHPNLNEAMPERSTHLNCITCQGKHKGTIVLKYIRESPTHWTLILQIKG